MGHPAGEYLYRYSGKKTVGVGGVEDGSSELFTGLAVVPQDLRIRETP